MRWKVGHLRVLRGNRGWVPDMAHSWWFGAAAYARSKGLPKGTTPSDLLPVEQQPPGFWETIKVTSKVHVTFWSRRKNP
ncbi:MAG: hypothetical protein L3J96_03570 [Thermoplasmata archaeon]|nr:hypothetical protein [Thermoplasmata archaeon]